MLARACEAVAYAHSRGVIHRDLKPENVMVGEFGQVLVMDWGLGRRIEAEEAPAEDAAIASDLVDPALTRHGEVIGTPAYMAPEQARGEVHRHGPAADVYALGAILHHVIAGRPPRRGDPLPPATPPELAAVCARALAPEPEQRHADAGALAAEIAGFLHGARRRAQALAELHRVTADREEIAALRARAEALRARARQVLGPVRPFDPIEAKLPGWTLEDEAARLDEEATLVETRWTQGVHGALTIDPDLDEAHAALADHHRDALLDAERARRAGEAARAEVLLRAHDRGRHAALLRGLGALSLRTDPEGARATLFRYVLAGRRLVPELVRDSGPRRSSRSRSRAGATSCASPRRGARRSRTRS
ncbi:MAG: serine/threonine-protein kinase [Minicystis sp.]